jgi:hypothetical protein
VSVPPSEYERVPHVAEPRYALMCASPIIVVASVRGSRAPDGIIVDGGRIRRGIRYPNDAIASE